MSDLNPSTRTLTAGIFDVDGVLLDSLMSVHGVKHFRGLLTPTALRLRSIRRMSRANRGLAVLLPF